MNEIKQVIKDALEHGLDMSTRPKDEKVFRAAIATLDRLTALGEITCACGDTFTEDAKCINCITADSIVALVGGVPDGVKALDVFKSMVMSMCVLQGCGIKSFEDCPLNDGEKLIMRVLIAQSTKGN